ncbi:adenosine receptor A1 [Chanos chanos]|uniref:Adenosine receptor A1 n=1 Tax=Chanos chanos TaxID=29144 RepID=A0A6J2VPW3_CHACN|nr:adenosine receptor A1-like [Chanos chanos]
MADSGVVVYTVLELVIAVACCLGNMSVIWAVWKSGALKQPTFCFVVSLAVADFLVGAVAVPLAVLVDGRVRMSFHGCLFISCTVIVMTQASVHSLMAIAIDRYLRVLFPLRYKRIVKKRYSWAVVTGCWITAAALGFIPLFGWYNRKNYTQYKNSTSAFENFTCQFLSVIPMSFMVNFNFFVCVLPPSLIMAALYCYIFLTIQKQLQKRVGKSRESYSYYRKERKLARSLALIMILFAMCWFPLHIMNAVHFYNKALVVPHSAFYVGILLSHANSAINPIVYGFKIPKIKSAYRDLWGRVFQCAEEKQREQGSQSADNNLSTNTYSTDKLDSSRITPQPLQKPSPSVKPQR